MKWHLNLDINMKPAFRKLRHEDKVFSIGSCFSENIGDLMEERRWDICSNPFGILYNPMSIHKALDRIINKELYKEDELLEHAGLFISLDHHGSYSGLKSDDVLLKINNNIVEAHESLLQAKTMIVTFGTVYHYIYRPNNQTVGNCHKIPSTEFDRKSLDIKTITDLYNGLISRIADVNPDLQWIFTVSPVRHWKDGGADNHWSKSILTCAVRELAATYDHAHYFPSYEIMMDELRDHRFYAEDLIHPSKEAVHYIWDRFEATCISDEAALINREINSLSSRLEHHAIHPENPEHQQFLEETQRQIGLLKNKYPHISF